MNNFAFRFISCMLIGISIPLSAGWSQELREPAVRLSRAPIQAGIGRYMPGKWGIVNFSVANTSEKATECLVVSSFQGEPLLQFGRRVWIPARSRRQSWFPVLPPKQLFKENKKSSDLNTHFYDLSDGTRTLVRTSHGEMNYDNTIRLDMGGHHTGFLGVMGNEAGYEAVIAARVSHGLNRVVTDFEGHGFAPNSRVYQGMDHLVLGSGQVLNKLSELTTIRRWVENGGKLWIMLDQVDPKIVEQLVGGVFDCEIVDRVGLTTVNLRERLSNSNTKKMESNLFVQEHEEPVDLVRVITQNKNVTHWVDGWPAAFRQRLGRGEVLVTTLGASGWTRLRTPDDPNPQDATHDTKQIALEPLKRLTANFFMDSYADPENDDINVKEFEPYLSERIGYRILSFGGILSILGAYCLLLLGSAFYFVRQQRLEQLGWIGPFVSILVGGVLVGLGLQSRNAIPAMVAEAQYVEVVPETGDLNLNGLLAVYHQDRSENEIGANRGGIFLPDSSSLEGTARRMIWTDMDLWHLENFSLPPGIRTASFHQTSSLNEHVEATASFGPDGLSGRFSAGLSGTLEDVILATSTPYSASLSLDNAGNFTVGSGNVLSRDEYISETFLSDEQRRRQEIYRTLLPKSRNQRSESRPVMFAWADLFDTHFRFPEVERREGAALLSVPISIKQTPPGTDVALPSLFIPYRNLSGVDFGSESFSLPYNNRTGEWNARPDPARILLRFELPKQVLPLDVNRVVLSVRILGPQQKLEVYSLADGKKTLLGGVAQSLGTTRLAIDRKQFLQADANGHLPLALYVGEFNPPASDEPEVLDPIKWKIEDLQLEVFGVTRSPSDRD